MPRTKKLVLAYPPFSLPTAPPLGACTLKGYIEQCLPDWSVKVIDLSLFAYQRTLEQVARGRYLDEPAFREGAFAEVALLRAADTFRGLNEREFYESPDRYSLYASLHLRLFAWEMRTIGELEKSYRSQAETPPLIAELVAVLLEESPDAIGLSLSFSEQAWPGMWIGRRIKERAQVPVILGGTLFNIDPVRILTDCADAADVIVTGEGESALVRWLSDPDQASDIPGATYRKGGEVRTNPPAFERDLDSLGHPDFSDLDLHSYLCPEPVLPVSTSRGCYWRRCAFCVHYKSAGQTYRTHSVQHVIDELRSHVENGITSFSFVDEMISPKRYAQLAEGIEGAGLDIDYYALAKPERQFDRELLQKMRDSGCRYILWGLESGNQRVLDLMQKGTTVSEIARVLRAARDAGLVNHVFLLTGFPTETREELRDSVNFVYENRDSIFAVLPSTFRLVRSCPVCDAPEEYAVARMSPPAADPFNDCCDFECSSGMGRREVQELHKQAQHFFMSFNPYSPFLRSFRNHALLIYARAGDKLDPDARRFPGLPV